MKSIGLLTSIAAIGALTLSLSPAGCGSTPNGDNGFDSGIGGSSGGGDDSNADGGSSGHLGPASDSGVHTCTGLECQEVNCPGAPTTVTGKVYDPAGQVPLYNAIVYVPNAPVAPFTTGPSCDQCGVEASGSPIVSALTDESGSFTLTNVPVGKNIPLVIQVGKWRRQVTIPEVASCTETKLTDPNLTRLPRNKSEGDIPQIAITTGSCDAVECLLKRIGLDASEFTSGSGTGRVHLYQGTDDGGILMGASVPGITPAKDFWSDKANLMKYDIVVLSCECDESASNKPAAALTAMHDYAAAGGRVFGTHYQYHWFSSGPADFQGTASWTPNDASGGMSEASYAIDTSFPKGKSFAQWLVNVGASGALGSIALSVQVDGDVASVNASQAQKWIYVPKRQDQVETAKYLSFNTPVGADPANQCGRVVFSDVHVTGSGGEDFPTACGTDALTEAEKALEFLFFDLSSCIQDPNKPPPPPPVK